MSFEAVISEKIAALEIRYFLNDPDDDPDRFGDGIYYRPPGHESWNGPWIDAGECREMYRRQLESYYSSLERKLTTYGVPPKPGAKRFLVKFDGILHPLADDVGFFLWAMGPGRPAPMTALIDAVSADDLTAALSGTVLTYGALDITEISGTMEDVRRQLDLPDPVTAYS